MNESHDFETYEEWFDVFSEYARMQGYNGPIDRDTFEFDFNTGIYPEASAQEFVKEMNS